MQREYPGHFSEPCWDILTPRWDILGSSWSLLRAILERTWSQNFNHEKKDMFHNLRVASTKLKCWLPKQWMYQSGIHFGVEDVYKRSERIIVQMHIFKNENMERVWNVAFLLGARLSRVRAIKQYWSHVEAILEPSWSHLEAILKPSWSQLRPAWDILEHSLIYLELWRQRVTTILDNLRATLGHLGAILEGIIFQILENWRFVEATCKFSKMRKHTVFENLRLASMKRAFSRWTSYTIPENVRFVEAKCKCSKQSQN